MLLRRNKNLKLHLLVQGNRTGGRDKLEYIRIARFDVPNADEAFDPLQGQRVAMVTDGNAMIFAPIEIMDNTRPVDRMIFIHHSIWKLTYNYDVFAENISFQKLVWSPDGMFHFLVTTPSHISADDLPYWQIVPKRNTDDKPLESKMGINIELLNALRSATNVPRWVAKVSSPIEPYIMIPADKSNDIRALVMPMQFRR